MGMYTDVNMDFRTKNFDLIEFLKSLISGENEFDENDRRKELLIYGCWDDDHTDITYDEETSEWIVHIHTCFKNYERELEWLMENIHKLSSITDKEKIQIGESHYEEDYELDEHGHPCGKLWKPLYNLE